MFDEVIFDELNEECGIFGVYNHRDASLLTYYGLHSLQHRGQESAGICSSDGERFYHHREMGLVTEVFQADQMKDLVGSHAIGHVRYSTIGESRLQNAQPLIFKYREGDLALATNGNLVNAGRIRSQLERMGSIFQTTSDTEVIAHLIARSTHDQIDEALKDALAMVKGAYALLVMTQDTLVVAQDPNGLRPLSMARLGEGYVFSSETCAFDTIGAEYVREVEPGELIIIDKDGMRSTRFTTPGRKSMCSFEYIYFARPDSDIDGINVHAARKRMGKRLAQDAPVDADVVIGVPDSSISAAIGYAEESGIPYEIGLIKNRYVGRTFIKPTQELREQGVKMKLSAVRKVVEGKRVVMIDDSIVRGTTILRLVKLLKDAGAKEVHIRISSPPVTNPCFYGIDTSHRDELIASKYSVEEMREYIGADSLMFLSPEALVDSIGRDVGEYKGGHCLACFDGDYPTEIYEDTIKPYLKN